MAPRRGILASCLLVSTLTFAAAPPPVPISPRVTQQLMGGALSDGQTYERARELSERIGPRLAGSPGAAAAVKWALERFKAEGVNAHLEPVKVPHWVRGAETAELLVPEDPIPSHPLRVTALGGSPGTPAEGITAQVVEVHSIDELKALGPDAVKGRIVFFNHPMAVAQDYGTYGGLRGRGPGLAAEMGAAAAVVRSLATASMGTPHTGATTFDAGKPSIPAAALSTEDAEYLHHTLARTHPKLHLTLGCQILPDVDSANVVAEVRGREHPEQVVVFGAHLDSWDLARGAQDDATGVAMVMEAANLITHMKPAPRRTIRFVLFMNEENGLRGGKAYAATHQKELAQHIAGLEADIGAGRPMGVTVHAGEGGEAIAREWGRPLSVLDSGELKEGEAGGADVSPLAEAGVPMLGVRQDATHYFDMHHSQADTIDRVSPLDLAQSAAAYTVLTYEAAESGQLLPRPTPGPLFQRKSTSAPLDAKPTGNEKHG